MMKLKREWNFFWKRINMNHLVIDACIIGCACRGIKTCYNILDESRNYKVCFNTRIWKEYEAMLSNPDCKGSYVPEIVNYLKQWLIELETKFGKKYQTTNKVPNCLKRLIKRGKFPEKDTPIVLVALACNSNIIISDDYHFLHHGKRCIESLGINIHDPDSASQIMKGDN